MTRTALRPEDSADEHSCVTNRCRNAAHRTCGRYCVWCGDPCTCPCGHTGRPARKYVTR